MGVRLGTLATLINTFWPFLAFFCRRFYVKKDEKASIIAYCQITLNTPVFVRSPNLSNVEPSQYLGGWPLGNTRYPKQYFLALLSLFCRRFYVKKDAKAYIIADSKITLNTPVLVRSPKLSNVEPSQYLDGWPLGNTRYRKQYFLALLSLFLSAFLC